MEIKTIKNRTEIKQQQNKKKKKKKKKKKEWKLKQNSTSF